MSHDRITQLRISGLRTIADLTLDLRGLTVLIGDNGTGKSSILEALELLRLAAKPVSFVADVVHRAHGGLDALLRRGSDLLRRDHRWSGGPQADLACLSDDLGLERKTLQRLVDSRPQKGNSSLRKALQVHIRRLARSGPVLAVLDRDQIHDLWSKKPPAPSCMSGITARFRQDAPGDYDLVFLVRNMETLVEATCRAIGQEIPPRKPDPDERDEWLLPAVWAAPPIRRAIRDACPSFDRLVTRVGRHLRP